MIGTDRQALVRSMGWDGKMFEPWPVSAGDRDDQDCDCDECGVSKGPKRRRRLILPSGEEDAGIQPQELALPPRPSAPPAPGAPGASFTRLTAQTGSEREMGLAAEPVAQLAAAAAVVEPAAGLGADTETTPQLDERCSGAQGAPRPARHPAPPARRTRARPSDTGSPAQPLGTVHEPCAWIAVQS